MRPSGISIVVLTLMTVLAGAAAFSDGMAVIWKAAAAAVTGWFCLDFYLGTRLPDMELKRTVKHSLPVGAWSKVVLEFKNLDARMILIKAHDHHPEDCHCKGLPLELALPQGKRLKTFYDIRPFKKGDMVFGRIDLFIRSPLALWWRKETCGKTEAVKVLPNFRQIKNYTLLAADNRLSRIGILKKPRRGEGNDFHQLRDYRAGDPFRQIDWNKTSRYLKLITKEYQDERDQQILFLLDCGRRMRHADDRDTHFDQALNAMLLLCHVALKQEDAVGFMVFGGIQKWFPPRKNVNTIRHILNQVYTLHPTTEAADYLSAAKSLATLQKKRSLVIILTNTRDEDFDDLLGAVKVLKKKHLVVLADLREKIIDETMAQNVTDLDSAVLYHALTDYRERLNKNHRALSHHGIISINTLAEALPARLVNEYLNVKASGKL
ncbi:MAG TPA: DUF58 domain-containing protein [Desulfobacteraceae bacterium]|nr:DUF58 domain-containing protein [Desulfobacteraceae bacterium]